MPVREPLSWRGSRPTAEPAAGKGRGGRAAASCRIRGPQGASRRSRRATGEPLGPETVLSRPVAAETAQAALKCAAQARGSMALRF